MAIQLSVSVRNGMLDSIETVVGVSPVLKLFTGAQPANCAAANSGTELFSETCPADWAAAAGSGAKAKSGTWSAAGIAAGSAAHFRLYASDGTTCHLQGSVTATGGGGDLTIDNVVVAVDQVVTVNTFTINAANS